MYESAVVLSTKCCVVVYDSPLRIRASLTFRSVPPTSLFPLFRRRTATSRRRSTMRSGCAMGLASCWLPAPRKTRPWKRPRTFRPAAPASWPTCQSCRGWRRPRSCKKWRAGRRTRGRWTTDCRAKEGWPSQASDRLAVNCVFVCSFHDAHSWWRTHTFQELKGGKYARGLSLHQQPLQHWSDHETAWAIVAMVIPGDYPASRHRV